MNWIAQHGYGLIFMLFALGILGVPFPDNWILAYLGYLIFKGALLPLPTVMSVFIGSLCGMMVNYALGRTFGLYIFHRFGHFLHVTAGQIDRVHEWFQHAGRWGLVVGYFLPGVRHLTSFVAGTSKMAFGEFVVFASLGGFLWLSSFMLFGYLLEESWSRDSERLHYVMLACSGLLVVLVAGHLGLKAIGSRKRT